MFIFIFCSMVFLYGFLYNQRNVQSPASRVQRPESSIQRPVSIVQHPESSVQSSASRVQHTESSAQSPVSSFQGPDSSRLLRPEFRNSGMPYIRCKNTQLTSDVLCMPSAHGSSSFIVLLVLLVLLVQLVVQFSSSADSLILLVHQFCCFASCFGSLILILLVHQFC